MRVCMHAWGQFEEAGGEVAAHFCTSQPMGAGAGFKDGKPNKGTIAVPETGKASKQTLACGQWEGRQPPSRALIHKLR